MLYMRKVLHFYKRIKEPAYVLILIFLESEKKVIFMIRKLNGKDRKYSNSHKH